MRVRVIEALVTKNRIVPIGTIMDISEAMVLKLAGKVETLPAAAAQDAPQEADAPLPIVAPPPVAPKRPGTTSAYCASYNGHCSVMIGSDYPAECSTINCEYRDLPPVPSKWGIYKLASYCPERADQTTKHTVCPCCKGDDFWESALNPGHMTCRRCHEPAPLAEKVTP